MQPHIINCSLASKDFSDFYDFRWLLLLLAALRSLNAYLLIPSRISLTADISFCRPKRASSNEDFAVTVNVPGLNFWKISILILKRNKDIEKLLIKIIKIQRNPVSTVCTVFWLLKKPSKVKCKCIIKPHYLK